MKVLTAITLFLLSSGCKKESGGDVAKQDGGLKSVLSILPKFDNPRNSEGDFITLKNGRVLFVFTRYTGASFVDHAPAYLASRHSDDQGETWSSEDKLVVENEGTQNVMSVSLLRLQNGEIAMFYLRKNSLSDCMPMVRFSSDEGETWTPPQSCIPDQTSYFILVNNRIIQLADGRLVMPVYNRGFAMTYYSDNNGRDWVKGGTVANPDGVTNQEPGVVALKDGNLMMIMRTDVASQYIAISEDRGETWTASGPSNIISATQSPASVVRIPTTNDLLLVWNNNTASDPVLKANRTPLNAAVSTDNGQTWKHRKTIESYEKGSYCYTAIHFVGDEVLLGYFDWHSVGISIKKAKIDWFYKD